MLFLLLFLLSFFLLFLPIISVPRPCSSPLLVVPASLCVLLSIPSPSSGIRDSGLKLPEDIRIILRVVFDDRRISGKATLSKRNTEE